MKGWDSFRPLLPQIVKWCEAAAMPQHSVWPGAILTIEMRLYHLLIALAVFTADQISKAIVEANIPLHDARTVIPGFMHLTHVKNRGAAFGIFADAPSQAKLMLVVFLSVIALAV